MIRLYLHVLCIFWGAFCHFFWDTYFHHRKPKIYIAGDSHLDFKRQSTSHLPRRCYGKTMTPLSFQVAHTTCIIRAVLLLLVIFIFIFFTSKNKERERQYFEPFLNGCYVFDSAPQFSPVWPRHLVCKSSFRVVFFFFNAYIYKTSMLTSDVGLSRFALYISIKLATCQFFN